MTRYLIEWRPGEYYIGTREEKRGPSGNEEDYPSFILEDGRHVSVAKERVIKEIQENAKSSELNNGRASKEIEESGVYRPPQ